MSNIVRQEIGEEILLFNRSKAEVVLLNPTASKVYRLMGPGYPLEAVSEELARSEPEWKNVASALTEEVASQLSEHQLADYSVPKSSSRREILKTAGILLPSLLALRVPLPAMAGSAPCPGSTPCTVGGQAGVCFPAGTPGPTICTCLGLSGSVVGVTVVLPCSSLGPPIGASLSCVNNTTQEACFRL